MKNLVCDKCGVSHEERYNNGDILEVAMKVDNEIVPGRRDVCEKCRERLVLHMQAFFDKGPTGIR